MQEGEKMKRVKEKFVAAFAEIHADIPASDSLGGLMRSGGRRRMRMAGITGPDLSPGREKSRMMMRGDEEDEEIVERG